jgi:hypothetical protein
MELEIGMGAGEKRVQQQSEWSVEILVSCRLGIERRQDEEQEMGMYGWL